MAHKYLVTSGADNVTTFTSVLAWANSLPATLTAPELLEVPDAQFDLTSDVIGGLSGVLSGKVTSAANYLYIFAAVANRHNGTPRSVSGHGACFTTTGSYSTFSTYNPFIRVEGIELFQSGSGSALNLGSAFAAGGDVRIQNCLIHDTVTGSGYTVAANGPNLNLDLSGSIIYGYQRTIDTRNATSVVGVNVVAWRHQAQLGFVSGAELSLKDSYSGHTGAAAEDYWSGGSPTGNNNASSDATATAHYTSSLNNVAGSSVFVSVTPGAENFNLATGTNALVDAGIVVSGRTVDARGTAIPQGAAPDIGALERVATSSGSTGGGATLNGTSTIAAGSATAGSGTGTPATATGATLLGASTIVAGSATAPSNAAFVTGHPKNGQVVQHVGGVGTISVNNSSYTGSPASIQARLVLDGTNTPVTGFDWTTKVASPAGGSMTFDFVGVPKGSGWYNIQYRDSANPGSVTTSGQVGVGELVLMFGQSNAMQIFRVGDNSNTPSPLLRFAGNIGGGNWVVPDPGTATGAIAMGNALVSAFGCPVGLLDYGIDGSGLIMKNTGATSAWLPATDPFFTGLKTNVYTTTAIIAAAVWIQGETEGKLYDPALVQNDYYNGLTTLVANTRAAFGANIPFVTVLHGWRGDTAAPDAGVEGVRIAQARVAADSANNLRVDRTDCELGSDLLHHSPPGFTKIGLRCAQAVSYAYGHASYYRGPHISSVSRTATTTIKVTVAHGGGSDFTPTSGITGWRVMDGATPVTVTAAVRLSAPTLQLTLAGTPSNNLTVEYLYGAAPDISGVAKDNSSLNLPLEFTGPLAVSQATATSVSFSVVDTNGSPVTASGLDYAFYDQPRISDALAPVKKGTALAISGGAVTIDLTGVTTLAPGGIGRIEWGAADGTKAGGGQVAVS